MNMIGAPKHVSKALEAGVDLICAQGGEGGGHTGDVATTILIPLVVDAVKARPPHASSDPPDRVPGPPSRVSRFMWWRQAGSLMGVG